MSVVKIRMLDGSVYTYWTFVSYSQKNPIERKMIPFVTNLTGWFGFWTSFLTAHVFCFRRCLNFFFFVTDVLYNKLKSFIAEDFSNQV
jgi:hypothetical protein